ncbi:OLC1v1003143C1 [Oldenlandia corymbosa var. corymbosa]|uniref:OLC1v1003143C1 n=1 Tax=Oldenlandia corymbosa var. corymbosa TaxID=529605 RepID=A0AAV1D9D2_OLDCO|nr:OLC1v1003143C1 [Oldenlandia corymbosa var. corymbosa]
MAMKAKNVSNSIKHEVARLNINVNLSRINTKNIVQEGWATVLVSYGYGISCPHIGMKAFSEHISYSESLICSTLAA